MSRQGGHDNIRLNLERLSEAENVVLIGHGSGCSAVMEMINHRGVCPDGNLFKLISTQMSSVK